MKYVSAVLDRCAFFLAGATRLSSAGSDRWHWRQSAKREIRSGADPCDARFKKIRIRSLRKHNIIAPSTEHDIKYCDQYYYYD